MQELHSLIHVLSPAEWQSLQIFLTAFTPHDPERLKYVQLAKMLMQAENSPAAETCCLKLYGKKKNAGFEMLKSRLKEKILDFLVTDISSDKEKELDEIDYAIIKMKKKSIQFHQLYYSKKKMPLLDDLIDDIIYAAKEYEQYYILIDHLKVKKSLISFKKGNKEFERIKIQMGFSTKCIGILDNAEHYYYRIGMLEAFSSKPDRQKALLSLKENIAEVKAGFEFTNSPKVYYYLKYLELAYYQLKGDYKQARNTCLELLNIVRNNKSVYRRQRVGVTYVDLSQCEYYIGDFGNAAESARKAQKLFILGSENYSITLEYEFYALFAMQQYSQSTDIAKRMIASATREELGTFRHAKFNFLLANALFKLDRFKEVISILSQKLEITRDKAGWEIGIRVLTIMAFVEMRKADEASAAIERLRKFIEFTDKKNPVHLRDKTILKVLLLLEREGFIFSTLNDRGDKHLAALQTANGEMRWVPFTHEIIPFHEWVSEKIKGKS